jgi:hypothetical protein
MKLTSSDVRPYDRNGIAMPFGGTIPITTAAFRGRHREQRRHPRSHQEVEAIARSQGDAATRDEQGREGADHERHAHQAQLFGEHREHEIGVRFRQVVELLATVAQPDAEEPAARERDERLHQLETLVVGVGPRIAEAEDAVGDVGPE